MQAFITSQEKKRKNAAEAHTNGFLNSFTGVSKSQE